METLVTFSVDDTSPTISYSPLRDTFSTPNLSAGWNPYFNLSGFAVLQGETGNGTSQHITSLDGASLALQWHGTGITLMGNATQASYAITVDGTLIPPSPVPSDNVLTNIQGLNDSVHNITLTAQIPQGQNPPNSSMLVFDKAVIFSSPLPVADNIGFKNQTIDDNDIAFLGRWSVVNASSGIYEFHTSKTAGDRAVTTFNGTTFLMLGQTSPLAGNYSVILDNTTVTLSGRSSFTQDDSLLFFASDLDPNALHTVTVQNLDGSELSLLVNGFKSLTAPAPTATSTGITPVGGSNTNNMAFAKGTIAAFALAGILAFLLLTAFLFFFLVYRPRVHRRRAITNNIEPRSQRSPKDEEAGRVLDIAPTFDKDADVDEGVPTSPSGDRRRWSAMSGFQRWRREAVRGSLGGISLGIRFRHSDSGNEKSPVAAYATRERPMSEPSDAPSSGSSARRKRAKRKGKARQISGESWTPSFTLDLPMQSQNRRMSSALQPASARVTSMDRVSSFVAAESSPLRPQAIDPPSYAASVRDSIRNSHSDPSSFVPSGPRSVSPANNGNGNGTGTGAYPRTHFRDGSRGFLLQEGEPSSDQELSSSPNEEQSPIHGQQQQQQHLRSRTPPLEAIPMRALPRHNNDSSVSTTDDNPSIVEPKSMREAAGSGGNDAAKPELESPESATSPTRRLLPQTDDVEAAGIVGGRVVRPLPRTPTSDDEEIVEVRDGVFLSVRETSPFRVDFDSSTTNTSLRPLPPTDNNDNGNSDDVASGASGDESTNAPYFTAADTSNKPSRNTFGIPSAHPRYERSSSSHGGIPGRLPEFVQGTSRQPFRLTPITFPVSPHHEHGTPSPPNNPSTGTSEGVTSFLDFSSSREGSLRARSEKSSEKEKEWRSLPLPPLIIEPKSRWSNTTVPSVFTNPGGPGGNNNDSSGESQGRGSPTASSTFPITVQVDIPPSPHHVMNPEPTTANRQSQRSSSTQASSTQAGAPLHVHPLLEDMESPTESIPMSVSDLHFRHSDSEDAADSRRVTDQGSLGLHLGQHPPLPGTSTADEYRPRPFDPSILVSRVLGLPSPTSTSTLRPGHSRSASGAAASSSAISTFPTSSRHDLNSSNDQMNTSRLGQTFS
ncbi:hypothetical protein BDZ97DRAFT_1914217 [Flammula alnicola]|nr:hypothetical protein BDZ97DRAFT_1914217 [Flammula alnicola]